MADDDRIVPSWHRWLNFWRLQRVKEGALTVEFYVSRRGTVVTNVWLLDA